MPGRVKLSLWTGANQTPIQNHPTPSKATFWAIFSRHPTQLIDRTANLHRSTFYSLNELSVCYVEGPLLFDCYRMSCIRLRHAVPLRLFHYRNVASPSCFVPRVDVVVGDVEEESRAEGLATSCLSYRGSVQDCMETTFRPGSLKVLCGLGQRTTEIIRKSCKAQVPPTSAVSGHFVTNFALQGFTCPAPGWSGDKPAFVYGIYAYTKCPEEQENIGGIAPAAAMCIEVLTFAFVAENTMLKLPSLFAAGCSNGCSSSRGCKGCASSCRSKSVSSRNDQWSCTCRRC